VSLERSFAELTARLQRIKDALTEVRITVEEDRPRNGQPAIADQLENTILELYGYAHEALEYGGAACKAVGDPFEFNRARQFLGKSQEAFHRVERRYFSELVSHARLSELERFARKGGRDWQGWTESVKLGLDRCRESIEAASLAFIHCWEDVTEVLVIVLTFQEPKPTPPPEPRSDIAKAG